MNSKAPSMIAPQPGLVRRALQALGPTGARAELKDSTGVSVTVSQSEKDLQNTLEVMGKFELEWNLALSDFVNPLGPKTWNLLGALRGLHALSLDQVNIQNDDFAQLATQATIRRLKIRSRMPLGESTEGIAALTTLEYLSVTESGIVDEGLTKLHTLVGLRQFVCRYANVNHGLAFLAGLPRIASIDLFMSQCGSDVLECLAKAPCLVELNLSGCPIGASDIRTLANFPALQSLSLPYVDLSDADIGLLLRHPYLRTLELNECSLTDSSFARLSDHSKLQRLSLLRNKLSDECCQRLRQCLPACEIRVDNPIQLRNPLLSAAMRAVDPDVVSFEFDEQGFLHVEVESEADDFCRRFGSSWGLGSLVLYGASDLALDSLRQAPTLADLSLRTISDESQGGIQSRGLAALCTIPRLKCLSLQLPEPLGDGLRHLSAMHSLEELDLGPSRDLGRSAAFLAEIASLRRLSLRGCVWRTHCADLAEFTTLEELHMHSTEFRFEHLKGLPPPPALHDLSLYCLPFTDEAWRTVCAWKELKTISLSGMTGSRVPLWKLLALAQVREVAIDNCQLDLQSDQELPIGSSLEKLSVTVKDLDEPEQDLILQRLAQVPCAVTLSYEINVTKVIHQLGSQRKIELIEMVGRLDPRRAGVDLESDQLPLSPEEAARRSILRTMGAKLYVEAE